MDQDSVFKALGQFLVSEQTLGDTLLSVSRLALEVVPGVMYAGMLLGDETGRPQTAVFTDEAAPEIDQAQYDSDRGPCLDAWRTGQMIALPDLDAADARARYAEFVVVAMARGVRSTLSIPLLAEGRSVGALNLYADRTHGFSPDAEDAASRFGDAAAVLVANSHAYWGAFQLSQQLNVAMGNRAVIEQAKGMLMASNEGLDADGAFELLKRASQRENIKVREIAQRIVDRRGPT
jgi:GAF domain-containing protein